MLAKCGMSVKPSSVKLRKLLEFRFVMMTSVANGLTGSPENSDPETRNQQRELWRTLGRDRFVLFSLAIFALFALLATASRISPALLRPLAEIACLGLALAALRRRFQRLRSRQERGFWNDLTVAASGLLAMATLELAVPVAARSVLFQVLHASFAAFFYIGLNLATERGADRPHRWRPTALERTLTWPSVLLVVLGLLIYFNGLPLIYDQAAFVPSYLFLPLDLYLTLRLFQLAGVASQPRWTAIFGFSGAAAAVVMFQNFANLVGDGVFHAGRVTPFLTAFAAENTGGVLTGPWPAVFLILAAGVRSHHYAPNALNAPVRQTSPGSNQTIGHPGALPGGGLLGQTMIFALVFPVIRYADTSTATALAAARETQVFIWLLALGGLALLQYRLLAGDTQELAQERARVEKGLVEVEQNLKLRRESAKASAIMRASNERFAKAFHACPDVMALVRAADDQIIDINQSARAVFGFNPAEMIGQTTEEIGLWVRPEDRRELLHASQAEKAVHDFEGLFRKQSGEVREGLFSVAHIVLDDEPHRFVIVRDVTETRRAERELGQRLGALADDACAVAAIDAVGCITHWNLAAEKFFGITARDAVGRLSSELEVWNDLLTPADPTLQAFGRHRIRHVAAPHRGLHYMAVPLLGKTTLPGDSRSTLLMIAMPDPESPGPAFMPRELAHEVGRPHGRQ